MAKADRGLGRGLGALLQNAPQNQETVRKLLLDDVISRENQPRKYFDEESLYELAESIRQHGILQPILVRPRNGKYEIIAGERRWRAAKIAELKTIPAMIREADDKTLPELALIENLQREDLGVIEEASAYQMLLETYGYTQEELAGRLGKSRVHISNTIRLLQLSEEVLSLLKDKQLTPGHARALLRIPDEEKQLMLAQKIISLGLSVRRAEALAAGILAEEESKAQGEKPDVPKENIYLRDLEERIQNHFSSKIKITQNRKQGGKIELFYLDHEDLDRLLSLLGIED